MGLLPAGRSDSGLAPDPVRRAGGRRTRWALLAALAGLLGVLLATGLFFSRFVRLEEAEHLAHSEAIARGVAAFVQARQEGYLNVLLAYAGRSSLREAVRQRDRARVLVHLRGIGEEFPELSRTFVSDPAGVVWSAHPEAPEGYGIGGDWYRGVSRASQPYVSDVFRVAGADPALAVALVAPIRDPDGKVVGIIGALQRLEVLRDWLHPIHVSGGDLYLVDRKGQFVFHRTRTGGDRLADYAGLPSVERVLRGEEGVAEIRDSADGEASLVAYRPLPSLGWGLVVHVSKNLALRRARTLILVSSVTGLVLSVALAVLAGAVLRSHRRTAQALTALEDRSAALQKAQEELLRRERLATLGQLAGGIGHELRNPLGVIKNAASYLAAVLPQDERARKHLGILEREVGTANRIVNGLLDFAAVKPARRARADLNGLVRELLDRTPLEEGVKAVPILAEDLPAVLVDAEQVRLVLANLVTNAVQAMPEGGTLTIETAATPGGAQVAVSDTGTGIAPENLEKIFLPLFTTKAKGIGLGLAVTKGLTEANGGTITAESAPGHGSRFVVRFARSGVEG